MPLHPEDFGTSPITLDVNDTLFLDTNVIVSYLYEEDDYHEACFLFLTYLTYRNILMCVSEVVVSEVINTLAKIYYVDDEYNAYIRTNSTPASAQEIRNLKFRFGLDWYRKVVKHDKVKLAHYNRLVANRFRPFLDVCLLVPSSEPQIFEGLRVCEETPLASSDALIISSAISCNAKGVLSLDRDMRDVQEISIYTTKVKNIDFQAAAMASRLGIRQFLIDHMGVEEYRERLDIRE